MALEKCLALGIEGVMGIVADSKAYSQRTLGLCLKKKIGLVTRVPRMGAVRQELKAWGRQQPARPVLLEKPGRTQQEGPRCWRGHSVLRCVDVEYADGRTGQEAIRFVVVQASPLAQQEAKASATAHAKEAKRVVDHITRYKSATRRCSRSMGCRSITVGSVMRWGVIARGMVPPRPSKILR